MLMLSMIRNENRIDMKENSNQEHRKRGLAVKYIELERIGTVGLVNVRAGSLFE